MAATKEGRVDLRIDADQKRIIERAAALRGQSVSEFIRAAAVEGAQAAVRHAEVTTLVSARDRERFLAILDADDEPAPALARAAARHRRSVV